MLFCANSAIANITVTLGGNILFQQPVVKYLGINLQPSLTWDAEIGQKAIKVYNVLRRLSWRKDFLSRPVRRMLVYSLAMPHIMQNFSAFTNMRVEGQPRMQNIVNSCTRFISRTPRYQPISRVRMGLNVLTYRNIRLYGTLCQLHRL